MTPIRTLRSCLLLLPFTLLLAPTRAAAPTAPKPAAPKSEIQTLYTEINTAFVQHDLDKFMTYFTPDYIDVDEKGRKLTKEETRQQYADQLKQIKTMQSRFSLQNLTATPAGTLVEMKLHSEGTGEKKILFMHFTGKFTDDLWVRDLWVETPQGWRLKLRKTLSDEMRTHPG